MRNYPTVRAQQVRDAGLDFRGGIMRLAHRELVCENEMKLNPVSPSRVAVTQVVVGKPTLRHLPIEQLTDVFFHHRIALIQQTAEALADQFVTDAQDIERRQHRGDRVPPDPAGGFIEPQRDEHRHTRPDIGEDVHAIGPQQRRATALTHRDQRET